MNHDYVCSWLSTSRVYFCAADSSCITFSMQRNDPLKIFIGSLDPGVNKPKLIHLFERLGFEPAEIIVPTVKPGKMAVAFVCFLTSQEALNAVQACNGLVDYEFTPSPVGLMAHIGLDNGCLFLYQLYNFITLGLYDFRILYGLGFLWALTLSDFLMSWLLNLRRFKLTTG